VASYTKTPASLALSEFKGIEPVTGVISPMYLPPPRIRIDIAPGRNHLTTSYQKGEKTGQRKTNQRFYS